MVARIRDDRSLTMLLVQARYENGGFYLAMVPKKLDADEIKSAFQELGIDVEKVYEIGDWQTTGQDVAVAFLPFPESN